MRILIDTNILINLEDDKILSDEFTKFFNISISNNCKILYHEAILNDLGNDKNEERKNIILSKLKKYEQLPHPAKPDPEFLALVGEKNKNDSVDNSLLFQVCREYVELLITEDKGIIAKAKKIGTENRVKNIQDGLTFLQDEFSLKIPKHPILSEGSCRELTKYKHTNFFDSLRIDYPDFDNWFDKCASENRRAYYLLVDGKLSAILIYDRQIPSKHLLKDIHEDALKMCTFKVAESTLGFKIGELFLGKMFHYCIEAKLNYLYLTVFEKHERLINLLKDYGFIQWHNDRSSELFFIKKLSKPTNIISNERNSMSSHPFYSDEKIFNKYIVPIQYKYSATLFKDSELRNPGLFDKDQIQEIQGNTIQKAYICNSRIKVDQKDILLFYISHSLMAIEPLGIVDSYHRVTDIEELRNLVSKRTVFSPAFLDSELKHKKTLTVILFRLIVYLKKPILYKEIKKFQSCKNNLATITKLSNEDYQNLKHKGYFDERYIIN